MYAHKQERMVTPQALFYPLKGAKYANESDIGFVYSENKFINLQFSLGKGHYFTLEWIFRLCAIFQ
jgi:hypothetical protein